LFRDYCEDLVRGYERRVIPKYLSKSKKRLNLNMDRNKRLKSLLEFLSAYGRYESSFDEIYAKLLDEIDIESNSGTSNIYLSRLNGVKSDAKLYIITKEKNKIKGRKDTFNTFVNHFRQDVEFGIENV
jgi:hypothetical protein